MHQLAINRKSQNMLTELYHSKASPHVLTMQGHKPLYSFNSVRKIKNPKANNHIYDCVPFPTEPTLVRDLLCNRQELRMGRKVGNCMREQRIL